MFTRESVDGLLVSLGEPREVADLALDEEGYCGLGSLSADEEGRTAEIELCLDLETGELALLGTFALPQAKPTPALMQALLEANSLYAGPGDDILGMDAEVPCVVLTRGLEPPLDADALAGAVEDFADSLLTWRDTINADSEESSAGAATTAPRIPMIRP